MVRAEKGLEVTLEKLFGTWSGLKKFSRRSWKLLLHSVRAEKGIESALADIFHMVRDEKGLEVMLEKAFANGPG